MANIKVPKVFDRLKIDNEKWDTPYMSILISVPWKQFGLEDTKRTHRARGAKVRLLRRKNGGRASMGLWVVV